MISFNNGVVAHTDCVRKGIGGDTNIYENVVSFDIDGYSYEEVSEAIIEYVTKRVEDIVEHYLSDWWIDKPRAMKRISVGLPFVVLARQCGTQLTWLDGRGADSGMLYWWNYYGNETEFANMRYITVDPVRGLVFEGRQAAEGYMNSNRAAFDVLYEQNCIIGNSCETIAILHDETGWLGVDSQGRKYLVCKNLDTTSMTYEELLRFPTEELARKAVDSGLVSNFLLFRTKKGAAI